MDKNSVSIAEINTDGTLEVRYLDYGNNETVNINNTRIDVTANKMPCQGIQCRLNRIDYSTPIDKQHHESFRTMCLNQTFTACFVTKSQADSDSWCIELFHTTGMTCILTRQLTVRCSISNIHKIVG